MDVLNFLSNQFYPLSPSLSVECRELVSATAVLQDVFEQEDERYLERKAGERLYHLRNRPDWAGGTDD